MGMTIAEKILARKGGRDVVRPGDIVTVDVDTTILFDNNFMPANWREILKVRDPDRLVVVLDHRVPAPNALAAARTRHRARVRRKVQGETRARRGLRPGHQPPARRRSRLRHSRHRARVQRLAYVQRRGVQLPCARRRRPGRFLFRHQGRNVVSVRRDRALRARRASFPERSRPKTLSCRSPASTARTPR